jgi:hypothetical protein
MPKITCLGGPSYSGQPLKEIREVPVIKDFSGLLKTELVALAMEAGLSSKGNKATLIQRLSE